MKKIYMLFLFMSAFNFAQAQFVDVWLQTDLSNETISSSGVHAAGSFQGWSPNSTDCVDMGNGIYGVMISALEGQVIQYKFVNGDDWGQNECGDGTSGCGGCAVSDGFNGHNREFMVPMGVSTANAPVYLYNTCNASTTNVENINSTLRSVSIAPNPFKTSTVITINNPNREEHNLTITSFSGKTVGSIITTKESNIELDRGQLLPGFYVITLSNQQGESVTKKLIVQ